MADSVCKYAAPTLCVLTVPTEYLLCFHVVYACMLLSEFIRASMVGIRWSIIRGENVLDELKIGLYFVLCFVPDLTQQRMRGAPTFSRYAYANGTNTAPVVPSTNLV